MKEYLIEVNISHCEGHRYAFEIHQYTQEIQPYSIRTTDPP